jgi:predicted ABC-type ATPase
MIIAGPNGSGKSTLTKINKFNCPIIDPDALVKPPDTGIAREISVESTANLQIQAGKRSLELWDLYLAENRSFAVETTLSGRIYLKKMQEFKDKGWLVRLFFIGLESPEINVLRVAERVRKGGHNVPIADIYRRYQRSMENLQKATAIADTAIIYDNSAAEGYRLIATIEGGILTLQTTECPQWFQNNYGNS